MASSKRTDRWKRAVSAVRLNALVVNTLRTLVLAVWMLVSCDALAQTSPSQAGVALLQDTVVPSQRTAAPLPQRKTEAMPTTKSDPFVRYTWDTDTIHETLGKQVRETTASTDTLQKKRGRDWATWKPDTRRALWLALVLPGAGQVYNRKYWKLPIIYGGFVGCAYAMRWNGQMYRDYSQAYLDLLDNDPNTQSYNQFLHLGTTINSDNQARWQEVFRRRKDLYRRWRDLSLFCMLGVYLLSVVDAYVDASLSDFDVSPDLSIHLQPTIMGSTTSTMAFQPRGAVVGLQCSVRF